MLLYREEDASINMKMKRQIRKMSSLFGTSMFAVSSHGFLRIKKTAA